jgi:hypothetical protein
VLEEKPAPVPLCIRTTFVHKVSRLDMLKPPSEHFVREFPNIYLSRDIKSMSERYGQMFNSRIEQEYTDLPTIKSQ